MRIDRTCKVTRFNVDGSVKEVKSYTAGPVGHGKLEIDAKEHTAEFKADMADNADNGCTDESDESDEVN